MDTETLPVDAAPVDAAPVEEPVAPVDAAPVAPAPSAAPVAATVAEPAAPAHPFVSLYDTAPTALVAVVLGIVIVGGVQYIAALGYAEKSEHRALTRFVTSMVAIMVGVYLADMLIAGPTAELLAESERLSILGFVKDTALMIFAYYFGTKAHLPTGEVHE